MSETQKPVQPQAQNNAKDQADDQTGHTMDNLKQDALNPYSMRRNGQFNHLGAALLGGGGGLLAYVLARMLGVRRGGAGLAGLLGAGVGMHYAYGKQYAGPFKYNPLSFEWAGYMYDRARNKLRGNGPLVAPNPTQAGNTVQRPVQGPKPISPII